MPCVASASGSCESVMLLRLATSSSAALSVSSETLMPAWSARCSWISCSTSRSSTCWRSTFCGGSSSFCSRSRSLTASTLRVQIAVEHHAVVDDRDHAIEQLALGGELAGLRLARPGAQRPAARQASDPRAEVMNPSHVADLYQTPLSGP